MEFIPVEMIAHIMSYLPLDARRLGTVSRKFGRAFRLFHEKSRISVDLTIFTDKDEYIINRNGHSKAIQPMKIKISTKDGSVTLEVTEDFIEIEKNTDEYTIEFCKSFFTLAEICGIQKPTYRKFLTDFTPLITINTLNLTVKQRRSMSTENRTPLTSLLLDAIRKRDCGVKTIYYGMEPFIEFPLQDIWIHLFGDGKCTKKENKVRLIGTSLGTIDRFDHKAKLSKYAKIGVQSTRDFIFFSEMMQLIEFCHKNAAYDDVTISLKGTKLDRRFNRQQFRRIGVEKIQFLGFEDFEEADEISQFPTEFEVRFTDQGRGLTASLELNNEGATYRMVSKKF